MPELSPLRVDQKAAGNGHLSPDEWALEYFKMPVNVQRAIQYNLQHPKKFQASELEQVPLENPQTWADMEKLIGPITWEWTRWLPSGLLTILAGITGTGKSLLMLRIAGSYLCGWPWPDGTPFNGERGAVLWGEAEAAQAVNLERARAWGLPLHKIYTPFASPLEDLRLGEASHAGALAQKAMLPDVKLIVVDSLSGADPKAEKSTEDAGSIKWLGELARDACKPILLSHHLRKRGIFDGDTVDIDRLRGASAIVQYARLVWALDTPDPNAKDNLRLQVIKSNLARFPEPVGMQINTAGVTFGTAPEVPKTETVAEKAMDLLRSLLEDGPRPFDAIEKEFNNAGISIATLKRAKSKMGIVSHKDKTGWSWGMPFQGGDTND